MFAFAFFHVYFLFLQEDKLKNEKGVRVGERDDTLPPEYRFNKEELNKVPVPTPKVSPGHLHFNQSECELGNSDAVRIESGFLIEIFLLAAHHGNW